MAIDLKPCPFCGELPEITKHYREDSWGLIHRCKIAGPISWDFHYDQSALVSRWNTRSGADAQAEIARLRGALSALELSANTVARCYTHRPENFASALQSLESDAAAARELLK